MSSPNDRRFFTNLGNYTGAAVLEILGPTVEFLTASEAPDEQFCFLRAVFPPGVTVPLHSHDDTEVFFIVSGAQEVLVEGDAGLEWHTARAGDFVHVPGRALHAHRNVSDEVAVDLIITTPHHGEFFRAIGWTEEDGEEPAPAQRLKTFTEAARRYGVRLGTPEENAAVGIDFAASDVPEPH